jgi:hypothetical protein
MKIYVDNYLSRTGFICTKAKYPDIEFVKEKKNADLMILPSDWNSDSPVFKENSRAIYRMKYIAANNKGLYRRKGCRSGFCVDDKIEVPEAKNFCFTRNDFCKNPYLIHVPVDWNIARTISKPPLYWRLKDRVDRVSYYNRVYWKGNVGNHRTRRKIFDFFQKKPNPNFCIEEFKHRIYVEPCPASEHDNYLKELSNSDMSFVLRGDRPSTHSFFDVIQCGCIPICVNAMNIGWENIMENVEDYMLLFDLSKQTVKEIQAKILEVLSDKEKVLEMKKNCIHLFETFFRDTPSNFPWDEFRLAKCIEIYKNDFDVSKIDNKLICDEFLKLKGLDSKI